MTNRIPSERPGVRGGKRDLNRQRRVEALLDAGTELFLEVGIEPVTIDEIARKAGMAKGNFYRYFKDKEDLVSAILSPIAIEARQAMTECSVAIDKAKTQADTTTMYVMLATRLAASAAKSPRALQLYLQERRAPSIDARSTIHALAREFEATALELSRVARDRGLLAVSDPRISALAVMGAVETLALSVLRGDLDIDPGVIGRTLVQLVLDGIRPR